MEIKTAKRHGTGVLINSIYYIETSETPNVGLYSAFLDWELAGGVVEPEYTQEELNVEEERRRLGKVVSMKQARLALLNAGLLPQIATAIASLPSPDKEAVGIQWEYATSLHRSHSWVIALATAIGLTEQQLDDLFTAAEAIKD